MKWLRALLVLAGASLVAQAQTNTTVRELSLRDCIELALKHNLDLQIDRYGPKVALYTWRAAYGAYDPSLSLSGQHSHSETGPQVLGGGFVIPPSQTDDNSFSGSLGSISPIGTTYSLQGNATDTYGANSGAPFENSIASASFTLSQPLLKNFWIDSSRLTIRVAKNRLKYSELLLKLQIMQTLTTLEQAYYDLIYNRTNLVVQQEAVLLAERLVSENKTKLQIGTLAPLDLQSAEAQAASSRAAVFAAQSQLGTQERVVKQLITEQFAPWSSIELVPLDNLGAVPRNLNLQDSWSLGLTRRPELLQAKLDVERQGIQLKYDKNQLFPELDVFGTYGYNGSGKEFSDALYNVQQVGQRFYTYGARLTVPLARTTVRNTYNADRATMQQLVLTLKKLEQAIMIAIDNDIGNLRANLDQVRATRAAREYEEAALDAEQKKLDNGKSTTYTVLQVQRDLTTARGNEIQALDNYNKSLAQLSLDEGTTLDRLNIDFQVAK
ncbi:Outer membrane efflux protein [Verrucomicrobia bacterium]|nr:Outer membrane efflux protein [Verrucomicrobiota bacterium]